MNPSRRRKSRKMAVDSSSARTAPTTDGLVILSMVNVQPRAAATLPMARTRVEHRGQLELYPFLQMPTEPALSTQTRTGRKRQYCRPALMQISGPTSSRADNWLLSRFPSSALIPKLMRLPHGTRNQNGPPTPPMPCPEKREDPPEASVWNSNVQAGNRSSAGMEDTPSVVFMRSHQK
jgi:hypothetical protein